MAPPKFGPGDAFAAAILVGLYAVMIFGIFFPMPLRKVIRRWL